MKTIFLFYFFFLVTIFSGFPQTRTIYGKISDKATKEPLPYATVTLTDHSFSTITDVDGMFRLAIPENKDSIEISYIGYNKTVIVLVPGTDSISVEMEYTAKMLNSTMVVSKTIPLIEKDVASYSYEIREVESGATYSYYDDGYAEVKPESSKSTKSEKYRGSSNITAIKAGQLTSGEVNDFQKWKLWGDITANELKSYRDIWKIVPEQRYLLQLENKNKMPVTDAQVLLVDKNGKEIWNAHTDNTGKAELWASLFDEGAKKNNLSIKVKYHNETYSIDNALTFSEGVNILEIPVDCDEQNIVDIAFVVDATGSMSDELDYLKVELADVIKKVKDTLPSATINLGFVFYRDIGDEYVTKYLDFNDNIDKALLFINKQLAAGGGDGPEAVDSALDVMVSKLSWSSEASARLAFMVLDASPHAEKPAVISNLQRMIPIIAEKGIRVIPVSCSGIDKGTEYFLRSLALATNGTYVFLTDDSGIGSSHIKPTTDKYDVELLNAALVRIISSFSRQQECKPLLTNEIDSVKADTGLVSMPLADSVSKQRNDSLQNDSTITALNQPALSWRYFPNPTNGPVSIEIFDLPKNSQGELYFTDITGKVLRRFELSDVKNITTDISEFPTGTYLLRVLYDKDKWLSGKIILIH